MSRSLPIINLVGTIAIAGLCVFQWQVNRKLNLQINTLEKNRIAQSAEIADTQKALKGTKADLEDFRQQITSTRTTLKETETTLGTTRSKLDFALGENEQLKTTLTNWMEAVHSRDEQLKTAQNQLVQLAEERNQAVVKFNELVCKYNKTPKDQEQRAKYYNALVEKYNLLAKEK